MALRSTPALAGVMIIAFIIVAAEGHFCDVVPLVSGDEEEAIRLAGELAVDRDVELWQGLL